MAPQPQSCMYTAQGEFLCHQQRDTKEAYSNNPVTAAPPVGVTLYSHCDFDPARQKGYVLPAGTYKNNMTILGVKNRLSKLSGYNIPRGYQVSFSMPGKQKVIVGPAQEQCFATSPNWMGWNDMVTEITISKQR